jgi:multidrug efflux pump subunit AcrA (membrane-fusion protein)
MLKVLVAISLALALNVGIWKWTRHRERLHEAEVATTPAGHSGTRQPDLSLPPRPRDRGFLGVVLAGESVDVEATVDGRLPPVFVEPGDEVGRGAPIAQVDVRPLVRELRVVHVHVRGGTAHEAARSVLTSTASGS